MPSPIDALITKINRSAKAEVLVRGADLAHITHQRCSTGSLAFDLQLGGGWPLNCWNEIIGRESHGKTMMALKTIAANQAVDPEYHTLWVASEPFDYEWASTLGVDVHRITFATTWVMEEAYDITLAVMQERAVDAVVIDSYPALVPSEEAEKSMTELTVGRGAMLTNKFMRKSLEAQNRSLIEYDRPVLGLFINQWRDLIGAFGDPKTTPGGKGKNYAFLTRVEVSREGWLLNGAKEKVGQTVLTKTIKNKTAPPQRTAQVDFYFADHGEHLIGTYDTLKEVWAIATTFDIVERKGAWYHFGTSKWNGKDPVLEAMRSDPQLVREIDAHVRHLVLGSPLPTAATPGAQQKTSKRRVVKAS